LRWPAALDDKVLTGTKPVFELKTVWLSSPDTADHKVATTRGDVAAATQARRPIF
jgi:hypothetical protein